MMYPSLLRTPSPSATVRPLVLGMLPVPGQSFLSPVPTGWPLKIAAQAEAVHQDDPEQVRLFLESSHRLV